MIRRYEKDNLFRELTLDAAMVITRTESRPEHRLAFEGPMRARWEYDRQVALAIADGFELVRTSTADAEEEHAALQHAIQTAPDAVEPYLVYGDWLQRRGDPRGELIAVQHALQLAAEPAERRRLERAEAMLIMLHRERLFGPTLSQIRSVDEQSYMIDLFSLRWYLGFIRYAGLPRWRVRVVDQPQALWTALLASDSAGVLREISADWTDCDQLAKATIPETLAELEISLERWWPPHRDDEEHRVDQGSTLEDIFGPPADGAPAILRHLESLLRLPFPALERLVLKRCPFARQLIEWLFEQPILGTIQQLDLSSGALEDADIPLIEGQQRFFGKLDRLDLQRNRFSKPGRARLAALGDFIVIE